MAAVSDPTLLITGDSGFIGGYLTSYLIKKGYSIRGLDLVPKNALAEVYPQVIGDVLDRAAVLKAMDGVDGIIHLAAEHKDFGITKERYFLVNEEGTKNLLQCASELGIKRFVLYSSVAVYGDQQDLSENTLPKPASYYGSSKVAAEELVRDWARRDPSRECLIIRPTVVFGPNNRANIFKLIKYVTDRRFIWVGHGRNIKSIAYVENLVEANRFLLERIQPGVQVFNYSDEPQLTTRELVGIIAGKAGVPVPGIHVPESLVILVARIFDIAGFLTHRDFPITAARMRKFNAATCYKAEKIRSLGFRPPFSLEEGLEKNVRWYKDEVRSKKRFLYGSWDE